MVPDNDAEIVGETLTGHSVTREEEMDHQHVQQVPKGEVPTSLARRQPFTYAGGFNFIHRDHFAEHLTTAIVVFAPEKRVILQSRSGVLWWGFDGESADALTDDERRLAVSLADTDTRDDGKDGAPGVDRPGGFTRVVDGWHGAVPYFDNSEQSEIMNALAAGRVDPAWTDGDDDPFPYIVRYGDTRNVCSVQGSVYAPEKYADRFEAVFKNLKSSPAKAGFS